MAGAFETPLWRRVSTLGLPKGKNHAPCLNSPPATRLRQSTVGAAATATLRRSYCGALLKLPKSRQARQSPLSAPCATSVANGQQPPPVKHAGLITVKKRRGSPSSSVLLSGGSVLRTRPRKLTPFKRLSALSGEPAADFSPESSAAARDSRLLAAEAGAQPVNRHSFTCMTTACRFASTVASAPSPCLPGRKLVSARDDRLQHMSENELLRVLKSLSASPSRPQHTKFTKRHHPATDIHAPSSFSARPDLRTASTSLLRSVLHHLEHSPHVFFSILHLYAASSLPPLELLAALPAVFAKDPRRLQSLSAKELALSLHAISRLWLSAGWRPQGAGSDLGSTSEKNEVGKVALQTIKGIRQPQREGESLAFAAQRRDAGDTPERGDASSPLAPGQPPAWKNVERSQTDPRAASKLGGVHDVLSLGPEAPWAATFRAFEDACSACLLRQLRYSRNDLVTWSGQTPIQPHSSARQRLRPYPSAPREEPPQAARVRPATEGGIPMHSAPASASPSLVRLKESEAFFAARLAAAQLEQRGAASGYEAVHGRRAETLKSLRESGTHPLDGSRPGDGPGHRLNTVTAPPHLLLPQDLSMVISSLLSLGVRPSPPFLAAACCYVSVYTSHLPPQALVLIAYNISRVLSAAPTRRAFAPLVHAESASPEEEELASDAGVFRLLLTPSISLSYGYSGPSARATPDVGTSFSHRCPPASSSTSGASGSSLSRVPRAPSSLAPSSAMSPPPDDPREIRFVSPLQLLVAALISGMEAKSARLKAVDWCCGLQALESLLPLASAPANAQGALRASWPPVRTTPSGAGHPGHAPRSAAALEGDAAAGGTGGASALERSWSSSSPCGSHSASLSTASCPPPAATASREDVWPGSRSFGVSPVSWDLLWTASDLAAREAALRGGLAPLLVESSEESSSERLLRALQSLLTLLPPQVHGLPANSLSNTALAVARLHRTCASLLGAHPFRRPPSSMDVLEGGTADMPRRSTDGHDRVCGSLNDRPGHGTCESACDGGLRVSVSATLSAVYSQLCRRTLQACRERRGLPPVSCVILLSSLADGLRTLQNAPSSISLATATSAVHPLSLDAASPSHSFPRGLPEASSAASTAESGLEEEVLAVFTAAAPHLLSPAGVSAATPSSPPGFASSAPTSTGAALPRAILPRGGCHAAADEDASTPRGQSLRLAWDPKPRDLVDLVGALSFMLLRRRAGRQAVGEQDLCSLGASGVLPPSPSQAASSLRDLQRLLSACTTHVLEALPSAPPRAPSSSPCGFVGRPSSESFGRQQRPFLSARDLSTIALHLRRCGALAPELFRGFSRFLADRSGHRLLSGTDFCCFLHALVCLELPAAPPAREREPEVARETLGEARGVRALSSGTQLAPPSGQSKAEGAPSPAQAERSKADAALTREAARVSVHLLDGALPATIASFDSRALSSFALWLGQHFQLLQLYDLTAPPAPVSLGSPRKAPASGFAEPSRAAAPASAASSFAVAETSGLASVAHRSSPPTLSLLATRGQLERSADLLLREVGRRCASSPHLLRDSPRHLAPSEHSQSFDLFRSIVDPQSGSTTASTPPLFQDGRSYTALLCGICKLPRSIITSSLCLPVANAPRSGEAPSESSAAADASSHADPAAASSSPWRSRSSSFSAAPPVEAAAGSWNLTLQPVQTGNARTADTSGEPRLSSAVPPRGDWPDVLRILLDPSRVKAFLSCSRTTDAEFADILWAIRHLPLLPVANAPSSLLLPSTPSPPSVHAVSPTASAEKDSLFFGLPELRQNLVDIALQTLEGGKGATGYLPLSSASRLNLRSSPSAQPSQALPPVPREVSARMERLRQDPEILSRVFFYLVSLGATSASVLGLFYPALLTCLASVSRTQAVVPASRGSQRNTIDATLLSPASLKLTACILSALRAFPSSSRLLREQKVALCAAALSFLTASSSSLSASLARASARVPGASQGLSERPDSPPAGLLGSADYGQMVEASLSAAAELRVNQPAEAIHALSESFLAWALTQASSRPLGTSQERGTEERGAAVAPWAPLAVRCAVALRSLDFPSASFLLRLLPPLVDSLSAPLGAVSEGSKRRQAALRDRVSQAACAGFAPARQLGTGLLHSPESSAALSRAAAFSQLSQLLLCVVCAAGSHVQREAERREKRQRGEGGQENAERSPYGCRDSSLVRELYFGKATRELLRTLLILYRSPQGAHASESQRRLDFLSILHILKDALLLALPLEAGPLRLMHALSTEVASGGGSLDPSLREALPSAAGRSAREDGERASASQDEKVAYAELWDLEACTAGSSAERPESSVLHKEVLTVTQRLLHHGQLPLEAGTKGTSFRRADGERSSGVHSIQWSLENAQRPQDGDCDADWKIVSEHRLGRLYYLDILISRRTGV